MKVAIISDSHDNLACWERARKYLAQHEITTMIHCGDVSSADTLLAMAIDFSGPIHVVAGNTDDGLGALKSVATIQGNITLHGEVGSIELDSKKIAWCHYPWLAEKLATPGIYDVVFYGHDHKAWEKVIGKTKLYNPGTLAGLFAKPTFAVYDTTTNTCELILIEKLT
jgi:putative phosphoesterase